MTGNFRLDFGQNHDGDQKPVFSRQILAIEVD